MIKCLPDAKTKKTATCNIFSLAYMQLTTKKVIKHEKLNINVN